MDDSEGRNDLDIYHRHVKPLEAEHWGKYAAIHPDGRTLVGEDYHLLKERGHAELGKGIHIFKVGTQGARRGPSSLMRRVRYD